MMMMMMSLLGREDEGGRLNSWRHCGGTFLTFLLSDPLTLSLPRPSYFSLDISSFALVVPASRPQTTKDSLKWHMAMASTFCPRRGSRTTETDLVVLCRGDV